MPRSTKYRIALKIGDKTVNSTGDTTEQALAELKVPQKITTKGFLTVSHGKKHAEQMFFPIQMKRFLYPIARVYMAKRLDLLLK